jgi:ABC-type Na+ efflux pump permease subunit
MIKRILLVLVIAVFLVSGIFAFVLYKITVHHNTDIRISESDNSYEFYASYSNNKTRQVQRFLDNKLNTKTVFRNARIDGLVTLTDNTNIYVKTTPGRLMIKLDKHENTPEAYTRIKRVGDELRIKLEDE